MIMINGNWEQVKDLSDIVRIVYENIGYKFAQKVEGIFTEKKQEKLNISKLAEECTKEELADIVIDLHNTIIGNNRTMHILLENCGRLENQINQMKKERK